MAVAACALPVAAQAADFERGLSMRLLHPCQQLQDVLDLAGLGDVLPVSAQLRLEASGEPEQWEMLRADEVVDRRDLPA